MKHLTTILILGILTAPAILAADAAPISEPSHAAGAGTDRIRFSNHDTLHGTFLAFGAKNSLTWKSSESPDPIPFATQKLQRIVLNHGQAHQAITYQSSVQLINGDVIPGKITSADDSTVTMETELLGNISIPRNSITSLSPKPFGGKLLYYGPLNTDGWKIVSPKKPQEKEKKKEKPKEEKESEKKKETDWQHIANAWYAGTDKTKYLVRENALPDQCRLFFKAAWRGSSLYANVILHADFAPPENKSEEKKESRYGLSSTPGHAYILSITSHSATLSSLTYDDNGKPLTNRLDGTRASLGLNGKEDAEFELRIDRPNKSIFLYVDGTFKAKWTLGNHYDGKGAHLAFARSIHYNNSELRISDIAIAHWNGMKDSAESMTTAKRDIILLSNGLDRFSGTLKYIRDGQISFQGSYGDEMLIPVSEVRDLHLATEPQKTAPETAKQAVYFFAYPYGRISGIPSASQQGKTKLTTTLLGEVEIDTRYINIIDFSHKNSLLDIWDDNF